MSEHKPLETHAGHYFCPTCREPFQTAGEAVQCDSRDQQQLSVSRYDHEQIRIALET